MITLHFSSMKSVLKTFVVIICCVFSASAQNLTDTSKITWEKGYLDIHHINTGRGNSAFFILPDGTTMLVDAGDLDDEPFRPNGRNWPLAITAPYPDNSKNSGEWIVDYIKQVYPQVKQIDYVLVTHFHEDHFGVITKNTKTSASGYKLSGITQVGDLLPIKTMIDRSSPANNYPVDLMSYYKGPNSNFLNYQQFIAEKKKFGLKAESLEVGTISQIVLKLHKKEYPNFAVRGVKANGTIWSGTGDSSFEYFKADTVLSKSRTFNENPLSLAIKLSYGKFDYFTGGDNTGLQGYGLPKWFDVETPMAKAVGKVEVATLDHHGNRDATNENFLSNLQPQVVVEQTWCSDHPGQEVMHRLVSNYIYKGEKNIFATNVDEFTKRTLGFWLTKGYKSMFGHVIIRVLPGGNTFYVLIAETLKGKVEITKIYGPYQSE